MLSIYDAASAKAVLDRPLDPVLRTLITDRLDDAKDLGLGDMTHFAVIQAGDTEDAILAELGWSPFVNPIDGSRYGTAPFLPFWSWLEDLGDWFELIYTLGNDGFAYVLLIEKPGGTPNELQILCGHYVEETGACAT